MSCIEAAPRLDWLPFEAACNGSEPVDEACRAMPAPNECRRVCAPYDKGNWCAEVRLGSSSKTARLHAACRHPEQLATRDSVLIPAMHTAMASRSWLGQCLAARDRRGLHIVFFGDSQTESLRISLGRWLDRGLTPSPNQSYFMRLQLPQDRGWSFNLTAIRVGGVYRRTKAVLGRGKGQLLNCTRAMPRWPCSRRDQTTSAALQKLEAAVAGPVAASSSAIVVFGLGAWDFAYSAEVDRVGAFEAGLAKLARDVLRRLRGFRSVDLVMRNMFVSYDHHNARRFMAGQVPALRPDLALFNAAINRTFCALSAELRAAAGPGGGGELGGLAPRVRLHFLDVWGLSWPRRGAMPSDNGDGMHWSCFTEQRGANKGSSRCVYEALSRRRADEVGWAAMQAALAQVCQGFEANPVLGS